MPGVRQLLSGGGATKTFLVLAAGLPLAPATRGVVPARQPHVVPKNIRHECRDIDEVQPALVNESDRPVCLPPEDCGEAPVLFAGHDIRGPGGHPVRPEDEDPVESKPGGSYGIPGLVIRAEVGEGKFNVTGEAAG